MTKNKIPIVVNHRKTRTFESNSQRARAREENRKVVNHRKTRTFESNSQRKPSANQNYFRCKSSQN